jgi:hypothetical protein
MEAKRDAAADPATRLFDEACRRLRSGELALDELAGLAARVDTLAGGLRDEGQRIEMHAAARVLRQLPDTLIADAAGDEVDRRLESSDVIAQLDGIVDWAWESLPTTEARIERARAGLDRLDRLPPATREESHVVRAHRADLADRLAALAARRAEEARP